MRVNLMAFVAGIVFAIGLGIGGMTMPSKIIGFLDFTGAWDASLALVMGGAVVVYSLFYRIAMRRRAPVFALSFSIPTRKDIDLPLIAGGALFGIGWGLGGFCPGPAIVSIAWLDTPVLLFVLAMCFGMLLHGWIFTAAHVVATETTTVVRADA
jgi:uncharacterized membrane protein YedE/YeeE